MDTERKQTCLLLKTGSCAGCDILQIAQNRFRWHHESPRVAAKAVEKEYCPPTAKMQIGNLVNKDASHSFGQERSENIHFEPNDSQQNKYKKTTY